MRFMLGFEMVDVRTLSGLGLAVAGFGVLCTSLAVIDPIPGVQPSRSDRLHPVAALAWSETNCDARLAIRPGTPRLQTEDLMTLSAALDEMVRRQGQRAACATALALAAPVASPATAADEDKIALARAPHSP